MLAEYVCIYSYALYSRSGLVSQYTLLQQCKPYDENVQNQTVTQLFNARDAINAVVDLKQFILALYSYIVLANCVETN